MAGVLENDVAGRIALADLLADLDIEVVVFVLGLPEAAAGEQIAQGAVGGDVLFADAVFLFGDERPAAPAGGVGKQGLEGGPQGAFVGDAMLAVGLQRLVILLDGLVFRLEQRGSGHGRQYLGERGEPKEIVYRPWSEAASFAAEAITRIGVVGIEMFLGNGAFAVFGVVGKVLLPVS